MKKCFIMMGYMLASTFCGQAVGETRMWYKQPAPQWDHGIPVGNGRLGAMVLGGVADERIVLNEESVWSRNGDYADKPGGHAHIAEIRRVRRVTN